LQLGAANTVEEARPPTFLYAENIKHNSIPDINEYIINKCIPDPENLQKPFAGE